eukprot:1182765-Prorocentrum_minimum.AAC.2
MHVDAREPRFRVRTCELSDLVSTPVASTSLPVPSASILRVTRTCERSDLVSTPVASAHHPCRGSLVLLLRPDAAGNTPTGVPLSLSSAPMPRAPECFYVEKECQRRMNIPVFHDDQHGTAIIAGAGLVNALELVNKNIEDVRAPTQRLESEL